MTEWTDWIGPLVGVAGVIIAGFALRQGKKANASARVSAEAAQRSADSSAKSAEAAEKAATAAAETARIDREKWHQERTPELVVRFESKGSTGHKVPGIVIANVGITDCETVDVTLEAAIGQRQAIATFVRTEGGWHGPWHISKLHHGDEEWHEVSPPDPHGGRTIIRCVCRNPAGEEWTLRRPLDSPGPIPFAVV